MSATQKGDRRSDESNSNNNDNDNDNDSPGGFVTCDDASQIMRLAQQRQSTNDLEAGRPDDTDVTGSINGFFDDNGQIVPAETVASQRTSPSSLSAWLANVNPDRHAKWQKAVESNMFPNATDEELLNHAVQNELDAAEADERDLSVTLDDDAPSLVISTHQQRAEDKWSSVDSEPERQDGEACPECDSKNTSSYQQQTGGADEGMTSFHKCGDCGKSWRGGYAA